jgi:hypothetical protein
MKITRTQNLLAAALVGALALMNNFAAAADLSGSVQGAGQPIAGSTVTLYAAGAGAPAQLAQGKTDDSGGFTLAVDSAPADSVIYVVAKGGTPKAAADKGANDAIKLLAVLGTTPPTTKITVNEFTTIASVWTSAQFLKGEALSGKILGLHIAAGNVPNFVNLETGGLGAVIQDPLNSSQTATLATFTTLADLLAGCITRVQPDACNQFFALATPPGATAPADTLTAAENIARNPSNHAQKLFALLDAFYPVPSGGHWCPAPFIPYLSFAPSAWTLSLVFAGGGLSAPGGIAFDGEGNLWTADNCLVGGQSTIYHGLGGGVSKIAPNGKPISPMTFGYRGGGVDCPGFGIAVAADNKVWADSLDGKTISVFDRLTGQPLSPATGYNFGGQLGAMQGIIATPTGDIWALDSEKDQIVYLPKGDATKGRILGRTVKGKPVDGTLQVKGPFHLAVDQSDRVWISNGGSDTVTRFSASDPTNAIQIKVGTGPHGVAIDSFGNAWVVNILGHPGFWTKFDFIMDAIGWKISGLFKSSSSKADGQTKMWIDMYHFSAKHPHGDVSMIGSDGKVLATFDGGKSILAPWGISIDGDDNVWVANALGHSITELCGARPENLPPGKKIGDPISPPGGYIGGLQTAITDVVIDPAGNVWVANNWDQADEGLKKVPDPNVSTRFGGNGIVIFYGLAKPVRTPLIGPVQQP